MFVAITAAVSDCLPPHEFLASNRHGSSFAANRFVGTWKLVSWKIEQAGGELVDSPLGPNPLGWIMYHPGGYMCVALMRPDRPKFVSNNLIEATPEELKLGFEGYISYCGSYEINEQDRFIIHHLQFSSFPNLIGTDQKRYFEFTGNRLTLKTPPLTILGDGQIHRLIWERLS
jgi:Lipocalin-like domain